VRAKRARIGFPLETRTPIREASRKERRRDAVNSRRRFRAGAELGRPRLWKAHFNAQRRLPL